MSLRPALLRELAAKSLVAAAAAAAVAALTLTALAWPLDAWFYDRLLRLDPPRADAGITMVVIDDASLAALGHWPWSRGEHARLLRQLDAAGARAIGFDVMFAEPDRSDPAGDAALADAIRASGRVVLPVRVESSPRDGTAHEVLPMPALIDASAGLGHVEIDLDPDGIARSANLYAGLGSAHWPSLALALRDLHPPTRRSASLPGQRNPASTEQPSPSLWTRDYRILVPWAETADFQRVSFVDVLEGRVPATLLRDRWILVGISAAGIGRDVPAPGHGHQPPMSGVEYHAHVLNALLQERAIRPLERWQQLALGIALVLLPLPVHRARHAWRRPWLAIAIGALLTIAASTILLNRACVWFAPGATLAVLAAGGIAWLVLCLRRLRQQATSDSLNRLGDRRLFELTLERELASARRANRPLSLLLVDVDNFGRYRDALGHRAGDDVLRVVGDTLRHWARRPRDLVARYDGDELALLLPECPASAATAIAQSILGDVRARRLPHPDSDIEPFVTLSIGVASYNPILESHEVDLVKRADAALYRARREGRNRVHCSSTSPTG